MTDIATMLSADRPVDPTQPLGPDTDLRLGARPLDGPARFPLVDGWGPLARVFAILPSDA